MSENKDKKKKIYTKVLFPIDGSENATRALKKAMELQEKFKPEMIAYHAVEFKYLNNIIAYTMGMVDRNNLKKDIIRSGQKIIDDAKKIFEEHEDINIEFRLVKDENPVDYAKKVVEKEGIDLIVIGCKGHSKLENIFLGSTTEKILNDVDCDVLVVR